MIPNAQHLLSRRLRQDQGLSALLVIACLLVSLPLASQARDETKKGVLFRWQEVDRAHGYVIEVYDKHNKLVYSRTTNATSLRIPLPPGAYRQRVAAVGRFGERGPWSGWGEVQVEPEEAPVEWSLAFLIPGVPQYRRGQTLRAVALPAFMGLAFVAGAGAWVNAERRAKTVKSDPINQFFNEPALYLLMRQSVITAFDPLPLYVISRQNTLASKARYERDGRSWRTAAGLLALSYAFHLADVAFGFGNSRSSNKASDGAGWSLRLTLTPSPESQEVKRIPSQDPLAMTNVSLGISLRF